jgi:hypothetical protein
MRGYNGRLEIVDGGVVIRHGLVRGLLCAGW